MGFLYLLGSLIHAKKKDMAILVVCENGFRLEMSLHVQGILDL